MLHVHTSNTDGETEEEEEERRKNAHDIYRLTVAASFRSSVCEATSSLCYFHQLTTAITSAISTATAATITIVDALVNEREFQCEGEISSAFEKFVCLSRKSTKENEWHTNAICQQWNVTEARDTLPKSDERRRVRKWKKRKDKKRTTTNNRRLLLSFDICEMTTLLTYINMSTQCVQPLQRLAGKPKVSLYSVVFCNDTATASKH